MLSTLQTSPRPQSPNRAAATLDVEEKKTVSRPTVVAKETPAEKERRAESERIQARLNAKFGKPTSAPPMLKLPDGTEVRADLATLDQLRAYKSDPQPAKIIKVSEDVIKEYNRKLEEVLNEEKAYKDNERITKMLDKFSQAKSSPVERKSAERSRTQANISAEVALAAKAEAETVAKSPIKTAIADATAIRNSPTVARVVADAEKTIVQEQKAVLASATAAVAAIKTGDAETAIALLADAQKSARRLSQDVAQAQKDVVTTLADEAAAAAEKGNVKKAETLLRSAQKTADKLEKTEEVKTKTARRTVVKTSPAEEEEPVARPSRRRTVAKQEEEEEPVARPSRRRTVVKTSPAEERPSLSARRRTVAKEDEYEPADIPALGQSYTAAPSRQPTTSSKRRVSQIPEPEEKKSSRKTKAKLSMKSSVSDFINAAAEYADLTKPPRDFDFDSVNDALAPLFKTKTTPAPKVARPDDDSEMYNALQYIAYREKAAVKSRAEYDDKIDLIVKTIAKSMKPESSSRSARK